MSSDLNNHPKIVALRDAFGDKLRIMGDGGPEPKDCLLVRQVDVYEGSGSLRRVARRRIVIQALNAEGKPISPLKAKWDAKAGEKLIKVMPDLGYQLTGGNKAPHARALKSIVPAIVSGEDRFFALESLDPDRPLTTAPKSSDFNANAKNSLPRALTYVDATDPAAPRRIVLFMEQNVGKPDLTVADIDQPHNDTVRRANTRKGTHEPDFLKIEYAMSDAEIERLRTNDGWRTGFAELKNTGGVEGTNVNLKNIDPNGVISAKEALDHHLKTIKTSKAALIYMNVEFGFRALGDVQLTMIDTLQGPTEVRVYQDAETGRERVRAAVRDPEAGARDMSTVSTAQLVCEYNSDGGRTISGMRLTAPETRPGRWYFRLTAGQLEEIREEIARLSSFIGRVHAEGDAGVRRRTMLRPKKG